MAIVSKVEYCRKLIIDALRQQENAKRQLKEALDLLNELVNT